MSQPETPDETGPEPTDTPEAAPDGAQVSIELEGGDAATAEQQEQAREMEAQLGQLWNECVELLDSLSLPPILPPDHPLIPICLDLSPETEERQILFEYVRDELLDIRQLVPLLRALQEAEDAETDEERRGALGSLRRFLMAPSDDPQAGIGRLAATGTIWSHALDDYQRFWFDDDPDPGLVEALEAFLTGDEVAGQRVVDAGRGGLRAIGAYLEDEWNEIADDYDALEERGVEPLIATMGLLGRCGGFGAGFLLCDYLVSVNHPKVEKAARAALMTIPDVAAEVALCSVKFEPSEFASRYVLFELLEALQSPELSYRVAIELSEDLLLDGEAMDADDREDMVEMFCRVARPEHASLVMRLLTMDLTDDVRAALQGWLDACPDRERIAEVERRRDEGLPLMWLTPQEMEADLDALVEKWGCETDDPRINDVMGSTPTPHHRFYTASQIDPPPGSKEAFLDKICRHEVTERMQELAPQIPEGLDPRHLEQMLVAEWWLYPRTETGWKPPLVSLYAEQAELLPDDPVVREEVLEPRYRSHAVTALLELERAEPEPDRAELHLDIATRYYDDDEPLIAYARERMAVVRAKSPKKPEIWTPGGGGGGGARSAPIRGSGGAKVGRNDPCPCGSGKKYKKCCMG